MQDGYFDNLIATIEEVDKTAFASLVENIRQAEAFAAEVLLAIENGEYSAVTEYSATFGDGRIQYKMNNADAYDQRWRDLYSAFANWLGEWEV